MTNSLTNSIEVIILNVRMRITCLKSQSTIMKIISKLEEDGSFSIISINIEFHSYSRIESCLRDLQDL